MSEDFINWLTAELDKRGWSNSELARRSGMAQSTISMILSQQSRPGWDFCVKVAQALGEPPEKIFRLAGLLPLSPAYDDPVLIEILDLVKNLSREQRQQALHYLQYLYRTGK